ncbi:phosphoglucomutase [Amylolactobacillus amylophilus DSM 20533 = JCM 1125]|nr:phosphoglucomutase [Amylolactobacillus amylophilus DSM 20533 = JCM 1125]GED80005.1 phosphoglucomutase [Amylolactobacillus amylophilus]
MTLMTQVKYWQENENLPLEMKQQLADLAQNPDWVQDAFGADLEFGTAGMRGLMEPGTNRMNLFTVGKITEGLARLIDELGAEYKARGVVICYDPRYNSAAFAQHAALILGAHGIQVYLFDSLRPTPELSFTIRYLTAYAGIMITASHNPKQYNGYKIYGPDGGQMPPAEVDSVVKYAEAIDDIFAVQTGNLSELRQAGTIQLIGENVDQAYLAQLQTVNVDRKLIAAEADNLPIVYSPLHGTGNVLYQRVFGENGFKNVHIVPSQAILDPEFISVPSPNPESPAAFTEGIKLAKKVGAKLIIATDPDADRMGCAVLNQAGEYELLTGNQIAALMTNYLLTGMKKSGELTAQLEIVKSIVSSELPFVIATSFGIKTKNVLTGFKYIGEEIEHLNQTGSGKFVFGFEESYGFLFKDFVRDKDSLQAALMMAEVAAYYSSRGLTVAEGLEELSQQFGYFAEETKSIEMTGLDGLSKMKAMMEKLRSETVTEIAGVQVMRYEDYLAQTAVVDGKTTAFTDYPKADVLKYYLADDTWIALRPSGTEPKVKVYVGVRSDSTEHAHANVTRYQSAFAELLN